MNKETDQQVKNSNQRGAAMIIAIFAILLVTVIGFALISTGMLSQNISTNSRQQTEAYYISEAGLTHAIKLVTDAGSSEFTNILQAGDGTAYTGDELSTQPLISTPIPAAGIAFGKGRYFVYVSDDPAETDGDPNTDSNGRIIITSVGHGSDGATVTTEAIVGDNAPVSRIAILADGDIINTNNLFARGPGGAIHANGIFQTSSNVCVDNFVSHTSSTSMNLPKITSGTLCTTPATVGSNVEYSKPTITPEIYDIPELRSTFLPQADFIFKDDGTIFLSGSSTAMTSTERTSAGFDAWSWNSGSKLWSYSSGTAIPNGTYYMEGSSIKISNGGDDTTPPKITLITEGSIEITNAPAFQPKLAGYALLAANDIKISSKIGVLGNPGLVYAYGHMEITNQSTFYGWLQAANFRRSDGTNGADITDPGGNNLVAVASKGTLRISNKTTVNTPTITGGSGTGVTVMSRREVRY